jgi:hypothetical protein
MQTPIGERRSLLMPKKEVLDLKSALQLEQVGDQGPKQVKEGKHRMR